MGKITIVCENCGKKFVDYESNHRQYCCANCKNEHFRKLADGHKIKQCVGCGKTFRPKENRTQFCGLDCYYNYIRENSYTKVARICKGCGKEFYPNHHRKQFCSKDCWYRWYSEYKKTNEQIELQTLKMIKTLSDGKVKRSLTKPHIIVNKILDRLGVDYINEYDIKYYSVDVYLPDSGLMIEVMGDYWHTNPTTKFKNTTSDAQQKTTHRDRRKHTYIKNQYNIEVLYLWESDVDYDADMCEELIKMYIENDGILKDYNSFNYELRYEGMTLKENITQPSFLLNNNGVA